MAHSGCNGGKKWASLTLKKDINGEEFWARKIIEKFAGTDVVIFNSIDEAQKRFGFNEEDKKNGYFLRPQKCKQLEADWLSNHPSFNFENYAIYVNSKWFSFASIGKGLRKIGEVLNEPLVYKEEKK